MAYCPRCGAATQTQFCAGCGAPTALPPVPTIPQSQRESVRPAIRRRRWPWFVGAGFLVWLGGTWFFYQDNEKKFAEARNTGVEILSIDEKTGVMTSRDRKTGKIIRMDLNDVEPDQVRIPSSGAASWIPAYPNIGNPTAAEDGSAHFYTADSPAAVAAFYESELRKAGGSISKTREGATGSVTLTTKDAGGNRHASIVIQRKAPGSAVTVSAAAP